MKNIKLYLAMITVTIVIVCCILFYPIHPQTITVEPTPISMVDFDYSAINTICELATLRSFYHNVVEWEIDPPWYFQYGIAQIGRKKFWIEYSGTVTIGIDASQISVSSPSLEGVIEVYIPDAKILSVEADEHSLSKPISETGWFTSITGSDEAEAFTEAQKEMRETATKDQVLLLRAKNNAKKLIEQYILNTAKLSEQNYKIKWLINKPATERPDSNE